MVKVLLYSGGMDSVIASQLYKPDVCLYVHTGAGYAEKELLNLIRPSFGRFVVNRDIDLSQWERSCKIVPMRNAFLVMTAANYGDRILLGGTSGDRATDTDEEFAECMTRVLRHMWQEQHWTKERRIRVEVPMASKAKGTLVKEYLEDGGSVLDLVYCISCYSEEPGHCGACKPCARKWAALKWAGVETEHIFLRHPSEYFTPEMRRQMKTGLYRGGEEDAQILEALGEKP